MHAHGVGPEVCVNKQPGGNRGFVKARRRCVSCGGTGTVPEPNKLYRIAICTGCNGRGYVREWAKES